MFLLLNLFPLFWVCTVRQSHSGCILDIFFKVLNPWHLISGGFKTVALPLFPADSIKAISLTAAILVGLRTEPE